MSMLGVDPRSVQASATRPVPQGDRAAAERPKQADAAAVPATGRGDTDSIANRLQVIFGSRFQVVRPVAIGGMATIFQLRHRLHSGLFVAKVLHPELAARPGVLASFRTEAINAAALGGHPNAVPIFDFGELDGLFFILMPFIEGEDLDRILLRSGALTPSEVLELAAQIGSLLSHAETHGIVHCDVTPGNIRLDEFGRYRLLDFGISQPAVPIKRPFTGGTPLYTSPEQLLGKPVDVRSDLYSLGLVLAEAVSGRPLLQGDSLAEIRRRHLEGDWKLPDTLQEGDPLARLLRFLLAVDPARRVASAFQLCGILDTLGHARPEFRGKSQAAREPRPAAPGRRRLSE